MCFKSLTMDQVKYNKKRLYLENWHENKNKSICKLDGGLNNKTSATKHK